MVFEGPYTASDGTEVTMQCIVMHAWLGNVQVADLGPIQPSLYQVILQIL